MRCPRRAVKPPRLWRRVTSSAAAGGIDRIAESSRRGSLGSRLAGVRAMRARYPERIEDGAALLRRIRGALVALALAAASPVRADVSTAVSGSTLVVTGDDGPDRVDIGSTSDAVSVAGEDGTLVDG